MQDKQQPTEVVLLLLQRLRTSFRVAAVPLYLVKPVKQAEYIEGDPLPSPFTNRREETVTFTVARMRLQSSQDRGQPRDSIDSIPAVL
jgi:hypothetical protein